MESVESVVEFEGTVREMRRDGFFAVAIDGDHTVLCRIAGRIDRAASR